MTPRRRSLPIRWASSPLLAVLTLGLAACTGGGPGSEEDLVRALTREDTFTEDEASCIASAVFAEYGADEEALGRISAASDFEALSGPEGVEGFADFFDQTIEDCTGGSTTGPTPPTTG